MISRQPSVFTPFFSRFTNQKSAELKETEELYERVRAAHTRPDKKFWLSLLEGAYSGVPFGFREPFSRALLNVVILEATIFDLPEFHPSLSLKEMVELRDALRRKEHFYANQSRITQLLKEGIDLLFGEIADQLPQVLSPSPFVIPLVYALPDPKTLITRIIVTLYQQRFIDAGLFVEVSRQIHFNLCAVSGITDPDNPTKPIVLPKDNRAPLSEIVDLYLADTPFHPLFNLPVPLKLTPEERYNHMWVVGGSGAGKTQLLQSLILHDLNTDAAMVIVDSQGDMIRALSQVRAIKDRIILITPKDIDHPPALNIFDINRGRLGSYDALTKEQVTNGVIETFDYLFTGLLGADLTAKQGVFFRYVARLMLALPQTLGRNATILDMIDLMDDVEPYRDAIETLPPIQRQFFKRDFAANNFEQTKEQIRYRLRAVIENPVIAQLFTSPATKIDLFTELNRGSIILVDTAADFLKSSSSHFGRIFISLVLQAILERAALPEEERRPAFLVVDEAAEYFDQNIDNLLTEARKYKLGCCFAHQHLDQCSPSLRASFAANTGIKMASGVSTADARFLAPDMRTTPDFILSQPRLHFACHIRNVTPQAVSIPIEVGKLEGEPRLSPHEYEEMRLSNRRRVSIDRLPAPEPVRQPPVPTVAPRRPPPPAPVERPRAAPAPPPPTRVPQAPVAVPVELPAIAPAPPKSQRKRPKKRQGPLVGDIDTSA